VTAKKPGGGFLMFPAVLGLAGVLLASQPAHAESDQDGNRSSMGSDIVIEKGESAHNVACFACSVYVHGEVDGNIAVALGSVIVDGTAHDKVAIAMGDLKVQQGGVVEGNTAIFMGRTELDGGRVEGKQASIPTGPVLMVLLFPFVLLVLVIWLLVWVIRRSRGPRYPYPPPPPPPGIR
jgi:cytoskeletal protein CcmA (bactofilin family)